MRRRRVTLDGRIGNRRRSANRGRRRDAHRLASNQFAAPQRLHTRVVQFELARAQTLPQSDRGKALAFLRDHAPEAELFTPRESGKANGETVGPSRRHFYKERIGRRRHPAQDVRIQIEDGQEVDGYRMGDRREWRRWSHAYRVINDRRELLERHAIALRFFCDQCGRDQLRNVLSRFVAQVVLVRQREEEIIAARPLQIIGVARKSARDAAGAAIVCGGCEIERSKLVVQSFNEAHGRVRGLERISTLVDPPVDAKPHVATGRCHELPHSNGRRARVGVRVEPTFDQREIIHVLGQTTVAHLLANHRLVLRAFRQPRLDALLRSSREQADVALHTSRRRVRLDVDVPGRSRISSRFRCSTEDLGGTSRDVGRADRPGIVYRSRPRG